MGADARRPRAHALTRPSVHAVPSPHTRLPPRAAQVDESNLIRLLDEVGKQSGAAGGTKKVVIQRKKRMDDEDEDDDF